jgi:hypothetical protein
MPTDFGLCIYMLLLEILSRLFIYWIHCAESINFMLRQFMNAMALASIRMEELPPPPAAGGGQSPGWAPKLVIQGRIYERLGGLIATPRFNKIYIFDPQHRAPPEYDPTNVLLGFMHAPQHQLGTARRLLDYLHDRLC